MIGALGETIRGRLCHGAGAVIAMLLVFASGADAKTLSGVTPDVPTGHHAAPRARVANLPYAGGPVMHSNRTHLIFWQPAGSGLAYDPGYQAQFRTFLARVARDSRRPTNVYSLSGQYHDRLGPAAYASTYAGAVTATDRLPPNDCTEPPPPSPILGGSGPGWTICLSDQNLMAEIQHVVSTHQLPTSSRDIYFLVLPNGFGTCQDTGPENCALGGENTTGSFCGYHSTDSDGALLYAVVPYNAVSGHCQSGNPRPNASTADPGLSTLSHEHNEVVTDPVPFDPAYVDGVGNENGDLCIGSYGPALGGAGMGQFNQVIGGGHYYLQEEWSNRVGSCQQRARPNSLWFAAPKQIRAGRRLTLTAHARGSSGAITAYNWFFGDRKSAQHRVVSHVYARSGSYRIVLRVTDGWGNWTFATRQIRVSKAVAKRRATRR